MKDLILNLIQDIQKLYIPNLEDEDGGYYVNPKEYRAFDDKLKTFHEIYDSWMGREENPWSAYHETLKLLNEAAREGGLSFDIIYILNYPNPWIANSERSTVVVDHRALSRNMLRIFADVKRDYFIIKNNQSMHGQRAKFVLENGFIALKPELDNREALSLNRIGENFDVEDLLVSSWVEEFKIKARIFPRITNSVTYDQSLFESPEISLATFLNYSKEDPENLDHKFTELFKAILSFLNNPRNTAYFVEKLHDRTFMENIRNTASNIFLKAILEDIESIEDMLADL